MIDSPTRHQDNKVSIERLGDFAERIDVRSPAEFAEDHVPGAESHPVLDDGERARIGTMHANDRPSRQARRCGRRRP
jgi:tRNA 2-selenouridine synthase